MARPLRIEYKGVFYHTTSRGNERRRICFKGWPRFLTLAVVSYAVHRGEKIAKKWGYQLEN